MILLDSYIKSTYGHKMYKLSLNGGFSCPNRDGKVGVGGCTFCNEGGSGDFTPETTLGMDEQIEEAKGRIAAKIKNVREKDKYIAYFQAYTNTYADADTLRALYMPVVMRDDIAVLSVATRPDCLGRDVLEVLSELNRIKPVWVELGLQTIHERSAVEMNRGYKLEVFDEAVQRLNEAGIKVIVHLILYWPGENKEDMKASVRYVCDKGVFGIKLQLLQVLKGTKLADEYEKNPFYLPSLEEYSEFIGELSDIIPDSVTVHRLTGDGPKNQLIAPLWCADKKRTLNTIKSVLAGKTKEADYDQRS